MRRLETIFLVIGAGFYVWFLHRLGLGSIYDNVAMAGWGLAITISLETLARVANTLGWRAVVADYQRELSFGRLFEARIAGEAIDYTTPSAQLGGQFIMALMVRHRLAIEIGLATVIVAAFAELLGQLGFVTIALPLSASSVPAARHLIWPIAGGLLVAIGLAAAFLAIQLKQPFSLLWKAVARLDLPQLADPEIKAAAAKADQLLADFYSSHRKRLAASFLCYLAAWSMGPIEIYLLLRFLGQHVTWEIAMMTEALGLLIERATFMIPAKLVSQEGGKELVLRLLGYPAGIGFAVGFLRRLKEMAWVLFGLAAFAKHRLLAERTSAPMGDMPRTVHDLGGGPGGNEELS